MTVVAFIVNAIPHRADHRGRRRGNNIVNPLAWNLNVPSVPDDIVAAPDFGLVGAFNLSGRSSGSAPRDLLLVFTLMLGDFFDTMGTMTAIGAEAG